MDDIRHRNQFLQTAPFRCVASLFDSIPGVAYFAKNSEFRLVDGDSAFIQHLGKQHGSEIWGKTDFDLFPPRLAEAFRKDDEEVIHSKNPKTGIIELFFNRQGLPDWYRTAKYPVIDESGDCIGLVGHVVSVGANANELPQLRISHAVEHIRNHYRSSIDINSLAELAGLSRRHFDRLFVEEFGVGAKEFIMRLRIQCACERLRSDDHEISDIALDLGFCDQSSFTRHFRQRIGETPLQYRKRPHS